MSDYIKKLMELKEIKHLKNEYFLDVKLSHTEEMNLLWKVDDYTAESLKSILDVKGKFRYRISFLIPFDLNESQSVGLLARTFREESEEVYFACSREYIENLKKIKRAESLKSLDKNIFIFPEPLKEGPLKEIQPEKATKKIIREERTEKNPKRIRLGTRLAIVPIAFLMFTFLTSFSRLDYGQPYKIEIASAGAIQIEVNGLTTKNPASKILIANETKAKEIEQVPYIKLENVVNGVLPKGKVALTFDDGPGKYSRKIADILEEYEVGGTFFYIGLNMEAYPEHIKYVQDKGFTIGSHSMNHVNFSKVSKEAIISELTSSMALLKMQTGANHYLFRPPYGAYNDFTVDLAKEMEYKMLLWNNDPEDWKTKNAEKILKHIKNTQVDGSVILLHEQEAVVKALPQIIEYLRGLGLEIVNLK